MSEKDIETYKVEYTHRDEQRQRNTYTDISAVNKQVVQADTEAAGTCCRCYDNNWPIRTVVNQVSDSTGKHCRDTSICHKTMVRTRYNVR